MKKIVGIVLSVIGSVTIILNLILNVKEEISVSVVSRANGPTSTFLAGKVKNTSTDTGIIAGIIFLIVGILMVVKKNTI